VKIFVLNEGLHPDTRDRLVAAMARPVADTLFWMSDGSFVANRKAVVSRPDSGQVCVLPSWVDLPHLDREVDQLQVIRP
jgi:hypothetical protein